MEYMTKLDIDTKYGRKTISVSCMDITHLYNYLDILICALIDSGFEFVTVNEL